MKFFNIDQHISVIADLKQIFAGLGHQIDDWCLSGHAFVFNRRSDNDKCPMLAGENWCGFVKREDWNKFFDLYSAELAQYDAFICCYPPVFAYLYKRFNKPIICHIPIRYDYSMHNQPENIEAFNEYLKQDHIILTANNKYDKMYCEAFLGKEVTHIPSLCRYTGAQYTASDMRFLYYSSYLIDGLNEHIVRRETVLPNGYSWSDITSFQGIVHFPYQVSSMSIFEHYSENVPLFFPSEEFMIELYQQGRVLDHYSSYKLANNPPGSLAPYTGEYDPNQYDNIDAVRHWLQYADYYDREWMPHITYFDSIDQLNEQVRTVNLKEITEKMVVANVKRKQRVYDMWENMLARLT